MWTVQDKREYDEATVLHWMVSARQRPPGGYPTQVMGGGGGHADQVQQEAFSRVYRDALVFVRSLHLPAGIDTTRERKLLHE